MKAYQVVIQNGTRREIVEVHADAPPTCDYQSVTFYRGDPKELVAFFPICWVVSVMLKEESK